MWLANLKVNKDSWVSCKNALLEIVPIYWIWKLPGWALGWHIEQAHWVIFCKDLRTLFKPSCPIFIQSFKKCWWSASSILGTKRVVKRKFIIEGNKCYDRGKYTYLWKHRLRKMVVIEGLVIAFVKLWQAINPKLCGACQDTHKREIEQRRANVWDRTPSMSLLFFSCLQ